jgi:hypothetical protein
MAGMVLLMEIPPSDDYWYCKITRRQSKGHFSLKDDDIKHSNTAL